MVDTIRVLVILALFLLLFILPFGIPFFILNSVAHYRKKRNLSVRWIKRWKFLASFLIFLITMGWLLTNLLFSGENFSYRFTNTIVINKGDTITLKSYDKYPLLNPDGNLYRYVNIERGKINVDVDLHSSVNSYSVMNLRVIRVNKKVVYLLFEDQFGLTAYNLTKRRLTNIKGEPKPEIYYTPGSVGYGEDRLLTTKELRTHLNLLENSKVEVLYLKNFRWDY